MASSNASHYSNGIAVAPLTIQTLTSNLYAIVCDDSYVNSYLLMLKKASGEQIWCGYGFLRCEFLEQSEICLDSNERGCVAAGVEELDVIAVHDSIHVSSPALDADSEKRTRKACQSRVRNLCENVHRYISASSNGASSFTEKTAN